MARPGLLLFSAVLCADAFAQCPRINFQAAGEQTLVNAKRGATVFSGIERQADGSFTGHVFTADSQTQQYSKVATVPNVEQNVLACLGLPARTRTPGPPQFSVDPQGVSSSTSLESDLGKLPGAVLTPAIIFAYEFNGDATVGGAAVRAEAAPGQITPYQAAVVNVNAGVVTGTLNTYTVGYNPQGFLAGDFDGDGIHDIAAVYPGKPGSQGGVSILIGNADGTFKPAVNYITGNGAAAATAWDFNGDGRTDLAVTNSTDGNVVILLGNGDGTFRAPVPYAVPTSGALGSAPGALAAADVNGDGKTDLVVGTINGIVLMYGNGMGGFTAGPLLALNLRRPQTTVGNFNLATGDFNKDGKVDIAVADSYENIVYVLMSQGGGTFSPASAYAVVANVGLVSPGHHPGHFIVEDFDGDGNLDLVFANGHPDSLVPSGDNVSIFVLYGNGDGTFAGTPFAPAGYIPNNVIVGDFNGDGKPDLAGATVPNATITVALNGDHGNFGSVVQSKIVGSPQNLAAADLNGDGKSDLLVTDYQRGVEVLISNGDGTFKTPQAIPAGSAPQFVAVGDFNHDGKPDLAVIDGTSLGAPANVVSILIGTGNGAFGSPTALATTGSNPTFLLVNDINHDGFPDLIVVNNGTTNSTSDPGSITILMGKGGGTFQAPVNYPAGLNPSSVQAGDFNADGKTDLVVTAQGNLFTFAGNGDGSFKAGVPVPVAFGPSSVAVADFDGDGRQDLLLAHCCGDTFVTYLLGNGDGTFQGEVQITAVSIQTLAVTDFNGDGKPDVAFSTNSTAVQGLWDGLGVFLNVSARQQVGTVSGAAFKVPPVAPNSIVSSFGVDVATGILSSPAGTASSNLLGTTISVQDSTGTKFPAGLFFVDSEQANYLMPAQVAAGAVTITITSGDGTSSSGTVTVAPVAPSIFTLNADNLAAAIPVLYHADGTYSAGQIYQVNTSGGVIAAPIDLGSGSDQLYLSIYGTGIRNAKNFSAVVAGVTLPVAFAGATSQFPGEDQVNLLLPQSLAGQGDVTLVLTADGAESNPVTMSIK